MNKRAMNNNNYERPAKRQRTNENSIGKPMGPPPFSSIGLFTYLRTYARRHDETDPSSTIESWDECINRIVSACNTQLNVGFTEEELQELFSILYNIKCSVAGRFLWQLGTRNILKTGLLSLQNCGACVIDSPIAPFTWTMNALMLGAGIGYRITKEDVEKLPEPKYSLITRMDTHDADFIVPDSREGWIKLLGRVLKAHFYSGKSFTYSCVLLRSKGAPIKGFGGLASGPDVLCEGMKKISEVLNNRVGQKMRPVDALDIMNIIGMIVVSGNVRRSAQLAIGDISDKEYLQAKRWDLGNIPNHRAYSNNSVLCNDIEEVLNNEEFWQGYNGNGEPYGLINLELSKKCGRLGDFDHPDPRVVAYNPCAEQSLSRLEKAVDGSGNVPGGGETCCLAEIYLPNITSKEELFKCAKYLYRICKHSLTLPCPDSEDTEKIVHENMRMGIGVTGYLQATEEQKQWLPECYKFLRKFDKEYSNQRGFPESIKLTTCKPSGCSRRDMLISTNKGLLRLDEIGNVDGEEWQDVSDIFVYTDNEKMEKVTKFYVNGRVNTRKIYTQDGIILESSLNHRYRVFDQEGNYVWKTVEDLEEGDSLACLSKINTCKLPKVQLKRLSHGDQPHYLTADLAYMMGLITSMGGIEKETVFMVNNVRINMCIQCHFGITGKVESGIVYYKDKHFSDWLKLQNVDNFANIPKCIRECYSSGIVQSYLNAFVGNKVDEQLGSELVTLAREYSFNYCISKERFVKKDKNEMINDRFTKDPIVKMVDSMCNTYDIEVENAHHYILNGIVSHNTLSLLGNCTSGVHPGFSQYYIRRIRISSESPLIKLAKEHGHEVEYARNYDGTYNHDTQIISFPCKLPEGTVLAKDCTAIQQLEFVKRLQTDWSDNSVSVTVYYRKEELPEIKEWLRNNYNNSIKTVSFLLHSDHGFDQAPMEEISKEKYEEMNSKCKPISNTTGICFYEEDEADLKQMECEGGSCPLR